MLNLETRRTEAKEEIFALIDPLGRLGLPEEAADFLSCCITIILLR